jgi:hypothetical protein
VRSNDCQPLIVTSMSGDVENIRWNHEVEERLRGAFFLTEFCHVIRRQETPAIRLQAKWFRERYHALQRFSPKCGRSPGVNRAATSFWSGKSYPSMSLNSYVFKLNS